MASQTGIQSLPLELLEQIFGELYHSAPSEHNLDHQPHIDTTSANNINLKNISRVSKQWRQIALPELLKHARLILRPDQRPSAVAWPSSYQSFLAFARDLSLGSTVQTVTLIDEEARELDHNEEINYVDDFPDRWNVFFSVLHPTRFTIVAPPPVLGLLTSLHVSNDVRSNYHMPYHLLSLKVPKGSQRLLSPPARPTIFGLVPWTEVQINEGSFLRPYSEIDWPLNACEAPSILSSLASLPLPASVDTLTYISIYPDMAQIRLLSAVVASSSLRRFAFGFLPSRDILPDPGQRGGIDWTKLTFIRNSAQEELVSHISEPMTAGWNLLEEIVFLDAIVDVEWDEGVDKLWTSSHDWVLDVERMGVLIRSTKRAN